MPELCSGPWYSRAWAWGHEAAIYVGFFILFPVWIMSGEAPAPVRKEHEKFADPDCRRCHGKGSVKTEGGRNDMYGGWRWCDCSIKNRDAARLGQS